MIFTRTADTNLSIVYTIHQITFYTIEQFIVIHQIIGLQQNSLHFHTLV